MLKKIRKNIIIYTSYLSLVASIGGLIKWAGLDTQNGALLVIGIAATYAILWPRW